MRSLKRKSPLGFERSCTFHPPHQHHTMGNEHQHHTHIGSLRNQQVAEIVGFEHLLVHRFEFVHALKCFNVLWGRYPIFQTDFFFGEGDGSLCNFCGIKTKGGNERAVRKVGYSSWLHRDSVLKAMGKQKGDSMLQNHLSVGL